MSLTEFKPESTSPSLAGPSRKRPRSEMTSEERKEARAHRNRIAAQNSRDRRKAQFVYLEQRIAELEEENKRLRAGVPPASPHQDPKTKENQELRARIVTLERGLEAVVKAFAVQGLPSSLPPPSSFLGGLTAGDGAFRTRVLLRVNARNHARTFSFRFINIIAFQHSLFCCTRILPPLSFSLKHVPRFLLQLLDAVAFTVVVRVRVRVHSPPSTGGDHASPSPLCVPAAGELDLYSSYDAIKVDGTEPELQISSMEPVDDATMETLFHEILYSHSRSSSPEPAETETANAGAATAEGVQVTDLFKITGQIQGEQETQTTAGSSPAQVSARSFEGVKLESSGEEDAETQLASLGVGSDELELMNEDGFGMGLDIEMLNGNEFLEESAGFSSGFTATWLDDYTTSMLEGLVPSTLTALQSDSSATLEMPATSWESLEASLSVGVGVF